MGSEEEIRAALRRLSPKLRAVIVLRYYWELSYAEMAQALEVPVGTVQSRLNQALRIMRSDLGAPRVALSAAEPEEIKR